MEDLKMAKAIVLIERVRLIESELFRLGAKYGIKTVEELDQQIVRGKLSEEAVGEDLFVFDQLFSEKRELEKKLEKLNVKKGSAWKSLQHLLELPRLSFRT